MPKDLKALRQAKTVKATRAKAAVAEYNTLSAKENPTEEEVAKLAALDAELDTLEAECTAIDADIAAEEKRVRRGALFGTTAAAVIATTAYGTAATASEPNNARNGGFESIAEFGRAVLAASTGQFTDPRLSAGGASVLNQNGGSAGEGFLVPTDFLTEVYSIAFEQNDLLGMAAPRPTAKNAVARPKDESTPWGASGVQAYWRSEASQMQGSKYAVTGELMPLHELYAFTAASNEVLDDAPLLTNLLTFQAGRAIKWKASDVIMWGDGVGKPMGFMNAPALITVNKDAGQAAKTLSVANIANMAAATLRTGGKPLWIANPDILPQLIALVIPNTTVPAFLPVNQALIDTPWDGFLLGWPLMFTEHANTLGSTGDLTCANLDGYFAAVKAQGNGGGINFASSMHLFFDTNETAFRWTFRMGGMPSLSKPVAPARGNTSKSHFVALQAR